MRTRAAVAVLVVIAVTGSAAVLRAGAAGPADASRSDRPNPGQGPAHWKAAPPPLQAEGPAPKPHLWRLREPLPAPQAPFDAAAPVVDVAAEAAQTPVTAGDLDPTIDVQITQEILDKAAELGSVEAIYEFVRNECEFQPYYGSRKGSVETLRQRAGNDYDLASLLIALLRGSGVPARYAEGQVEIPAGRVNAWLGVDDAQVAGSILFTSGMEGISLLSPTTDCCAGHATAGCDDPALEACVCAVDAYCCNTQWDTQCAAEVDDFGCAVCAELTEAVAVRARRVWVEALVPRGFGDAVWVPLDPAFRQVEVAPGFDVLEEMGLDARGFVEDYFDPADPGVALPRPETIVELLKQDVGDYLDTYYPGMAVADVVRTQESIPEMLEILPASLPYTVRSRDGSFAEIPADRRYQIRFHLYDGATTLIDHTLDLPAVAGSRLSIDYVGATPADQAILDANGGIYATPPWQVSLKPVLRVDGSDVAVGAAGVGMGRLHSSDLHFLAPVNGSGLPQNVVPAIFNVNLTGAAQVVGLAVDGLSEGMLDPPPADDTEGLASLRHDVALDYLASVRNDTRELAHLMHDFVTTDVADAIVENVVRVTYDIFGTPLTFDWVGLRVDADRSVLGIWPVDRLDPPGGEPRDLLVLAGAEGSLLESLIYERSFGQDSVSTIKILELAADAGVTIYKRWATLPLPANTQPSSVRASLQNAILAGHDVTFPASPMTFGAPATGQWTGTGWIDMDPADGAAGYLISGNNNGGATVEAWPPEFIDLSEDDKTIVRVEIEIVTPAADSPAGDAIFTRDVEQTLVFEYKVHVTYDDGSTRTLPAAGNYRRETRNTTRTFVPDNYVFKMWIARRIWWIFTITIAEAERKVTIAGVLVRGPDVFFGLFGCGSDPPRFLPILPAASGTISEDVQACVYPERDPDGNPLAQGYAWTGGPQLTFTMPAARQTQIRPAGAPSAALDDQDVNVTVDLPGGKQAMGSASFNFTRGGSDPRHKMTVYRVTMEYPSAPPLNQPAAGPDYFGNEFTFDASASGVVTVRCRAMLEPNVAEVRDLVDDELRWEIPNLSTFLGFGGWSWTESWGFFSSGGKGHGITNPLFATESGLPSSNGTFGRKTVKLSLEVKGTLYEVANREVEFFYNATATNHPGGTTPNWFYYYRDNAGGTDYTYGCSGGRSYSFSGVAGSVHICDEAYLGDQYITTAVAGGQRVATGVSGTTRYYANFLGVLAHERQHANNETPGVNDPDGDRLSNAFETGTSLTNPNNACSAAGPFPCPPFDDGEVYAGGPVEQGGIAGANTAMDWADPGTNHGP
jgi:hypothetical protein